MNEVQNQVVQRPQRAHHRPEDDEPVSPTTRRPSLNDREATELQSVSSSRRLSRSERRQLRLRYLYRYPTHDDGLPHGKISTLWKRHISMKVPHEACRDHYALERTFLGYLRTSLGLSMMSVLIAQLFRILHLKTTHPFGFYATGVPLAIVFLVGSIVIAVFGGSRFIRQQNAMARGKVHARGYELIGTGLVVMTVTMVLFIVMMAIFIYEDVNHII